MLHSHLVVLLVFSVLVSIVFATLLRPDLRSRLRFGAYVFLAFVVSALAVGWIMLPLPPHR